MKLSPLYQALIFIEDKKEASLADLSFLSKPVLRGILGKMEAMKLIEKMPTDNFRISSKGQALLNRFLDNLHTSTLHFDGYWRLVCFSIPELQRPIRDRFRRDLEAMGLKMALTGLWLTPLELEGVIEKRARELNIFDKVIISKTNQLISGLDATRLISLWDFDSSKQEIYDYIEDAEKFLKLSNKTSYEAKKMIFRYALILENQPKLPIELFPKDWPQFRANLIYKKVRRSLGI
jgi:phenylacetic acid degradation operon negative regulatory protein